jgi:hypothetical protein
MACSANILLATVEEILILFLREVDLNRPVMALKVATVADWKTKEEKKKS